MEYSVLVLLILELYTHFLYNILIIEERETPFQCRHLN